MNLLKSGAISMGYKAISTNDRTSINAHRYKARYGPPFCTMIMMAATIGGPTATMRPNPISMSLKKSQIVCCNVQKPNARVKPLERKLILLSQRSHDINLPKTVIANRAERIPNQFKCIFLWVKDWSDLVEAMSCLYDKSRVQGEGKFYHLSIPETQVT